MLYHLLDVVEEKQSVDLSSSSSLISPSDSTSTFERQYAQQKISSRDQVGKEPLENVNIQEAQKIANDIKRRLKTKLNRELSEIKISDIEPVESTMNISPDMEIILKRKNDVSDKLVASTSKGIIKTKLKSNLKQTGVQTDEKVRDKSLKVKIDSHTNVFSSETTLKVKVDPQHLKENKETQTSKEKQE